MPKINKKNLIRILRLASGISLNIVYLLSNLFQRNSNKWIFSAWNGKKFLDNPKHIYQYVMQNHPDIEAIWISRDYKLAKNLKKQGINAEYIGSLRGIWAQLTAGVAIFSHSVVWEFWAALISRKVYRVQTWHGIPIKHIGFDDQKDLFAKKTKLITTLMPYKSNHLNMITAVGEADKECYRTAFRVNEDTIKITGYARNDALINNMKLNDVLNHRKKINVIYMPTFRGLVGSEFQLFKSTKFNFDYYDKLCGDIGIDLWVKLHPVQVYLKQDLDKINTCKNIHALENVDDIYEEIGKYDILITDFSGIYFDFLITGKPIIMAPLEMIDYINNDRGLYYKYEDICPEIPCKNWDEVFNMIKKVINNNMYTSKKYSEMKNKFHKFDDNNSSRRVVNYILDSIR